MEKLESKSRNCIHALPFFDSMVSSKQHYMFMAHPTCMIKPASFCLHPHNFVFGWWRQMDPIFALQSLLGRIHRWQRARNAGFDIFSNILFASLGGNALRFGVANSWSMVSLYLVGWIFLIIYYQLYWRHFAQGIPLCWYVHKNTKPGILICDSIMLSAKLFLYSNYFCHRLAYAVSILRPGQNCRHFPNAFSWIKMHKFRITFHWSLFLIFELTIIPHWFI